MSNDFLCIFQMPLIAEYVEKTYVKISDIKNIVDRDDVERENNILAPLLFKKKYPVEYVVVGLPASGKTTLIGAIQSEREIKSISTDDFVYFVKCYFLDMGKFPNLKLSKSNSDEFKKFEYHVVLSLLLSNMSDNAVIDFGGSVFLQPNLAILLTNLVKNKIINLKINPEERVYNLMQDYLSLGELSFRKTLSKTIKQMIEEEKYFEEFVSIKEKYSAIFKNEKRLNSATERLVNLKEKLKFQNYLKEQRLLERIHNIAQEWDNERNWRQAIYDQYAAPANFQDIVRNMKSKVHNLKRDK